MVITADLKSEAVGTEINGGKEGVRRVVRHDAMLKMTLVEMIPLEM
jgi:hypothetical protein